MIVSAHVLDWAQREPDRPALLTRARTSVTYGELAERAQRWAEKCPSPARIALTPRSDLTSITAILGTWSAGSSVVLMHRHLTRTQTSHVLDRSRAAVLLDDDMSPQWLGDPATEVSPEELFVGLTSGTSGAPKLFARSHGSWNATFVRSDWLFGLQPGTRVAVPGAIDHSHFLYGAVHALARGATVDLRGTADAAWDDVEVVYSVPTMATDLVDLGRPLVAVRVVLSSGADWPASGRRALGALLPVGADIFDFYGAGELSFVSVSEGDGPPACVGRPFPGVEVRVTDTGDKRGRDLIGLIEVRSDMIFSGYLDANGFVQPPSGGWATAGDRGFIDSEGLLHLSGRESRMFTRGALNVEPELIERALAEHPTVAAAACLPREHRRWGAEPVVFVEAAEPVATAELHLWCARTLDVVHRPSHIELIAKLPVTPRGKTDFRALGRILASLG